MLGLAIQILADALYSTHGMVLLLGALGYLAFFAFDAIRSQPSASRRGSKVEGQTHLIVAVVLFVVALAAMTYAAPTPNEATCAEVDTSEEFQAPLAVYQSTAPQSETADKPPLASKFHGGAISKGMRLSRALQEARQPAEAIAVNTPSTSENKAVLPPTLETCKSMLATEQSPPSQLLRQLNCYGDLVEDSKSPRAHAAEVLPASRKLMAALYARAKENTEIWASAQVQWARVTHDVLQSQCSAANDELRSLRRAKSAPAKVVVIALHKLKKLENPLKEAFTAARQVAVSLEADSLVQALDVDEISDLHESQVAVSTCMLEAIQEARTLAETLPRSTAHVRTALQCSGDMLAGLEKLVIKSANQLQDANSAFALGTYLSVQAVTETSSVPFFGSADTSSRWVAGGGDLHVPENIATAEDLLLRGEELTPGSLQGDRAAARALRLYQHAKHLALLHHDSAAEWRYRESARVAAAHRRPKLAAHSLTRLGYFLSLRGRKEEAQEVIKEALVHFEDPLAQYLQVSFRRTAGELTTDVEVRSAEAVLGAVAGRLPSKSLEEQRAQDHEDFIWWGRVADGGIRVCFEAQDVAQFLTCTLCGFMYNLPLASPA
jgi:hypothetical protein